MVEPSGDAPEDAAAGGGWSTRRVIGAIAAGALLLLAVLRLGPSASTATSFVADAPARPVPDEQLVPTSVEELEGMIVGLRGTPVVVNIWASWCAPCRAEMPLLERAAREYEGEVVVLGVDSRDAVGPAEDFLEDVGVTYPNVFDESGAIRRALDLRGFPTTYFFDRDGELVASVVGGITEARLAAQLAELT